MSGTLRFPLANPIRIAILEMTGINRADIDFNLWYEKSHPAIQDSFCQRYQTSDTIYFQFHTSFANNFVELVRVRDKFIVKSDETEAEMLFEDGENMLFEDDSQMLFEGDDDTYADTVYTESGIDTYEAVVELTGLEPGKYYIQIRGNHTDGETYFARSEMIDVQVTHRDTVLITYYNNEAAFDLDYRSSTFNPTIRIYADYIKPIQDNDFDNITSANSFITKVTDNTLTGRQLETLETMPGWIYEKLNLILAHDNIDIDGKTVVGGEKFSLEYEVDGKAWLDWPQRVPIFFAQSTAQNRYDTGTRAAYS